MNELKEKWVTLTVEERKEAMDAAYNGGSWETNAIAAGMVKNGSTASFCSTDNHSTIALFLNQA